VNVTQTERHMTMNRFEQHCASTPTTPPNRIRNYPLKSLTPLYRFQAVIFAITSLFTTTFALAQNPTNTQVLGQQILAKAIEAHGGLERFRSFGTLTYHTDGLPYSEAAPLNFDHTADLVARHHRMEGHSTKGPFIAGSDDTQAWTTDTETLGIPPRWVNHGNSYFVLMPFVFADPGTHVRSVGKRIYDGQTYDAIAIRYDRNTGDTSDDDYVLYIDQATHYLRLIDFSVTYGPMRGDTPIDQLPRRSLEFVEWQEVDGLNIPKALRYAPWEQTADGGQQKEEGVRYTISDANFDTVRPDVSLFKAPKGAIVEIP